MKGQALLFTGWYAQALEAFQRTLELDPTQAPAYMGQGVILLALKRYWPGIKSIGHSVFVSFRVLLTHLFRR
jgi:tetratricopeptide (TPR) repeat protein